MAKKEKLSLDERKALAKKNQRVLIAVAIGMVIGVITIGAYISSANTAKTMNQSAPPPPKSNDVAGAASQLKSEQKKFDNTDTSPSAIAQKQQEDSDKKRALVDGVSHINSTKVLANKTNGLKAADTSAASAEVKITSTEKKEVTVTEAEPQPVVEKKEPEKTPRSTILARNTASLFTQKAYFPPIPQATQIVPKGKLIATITPALDKADAESSISFTGLRNQFITPDPIAPAGTGGASDATMTGNPTVPDNTPASESDLKTVRVADMGQGVLGVISDSINSDYNVDVYIDLVEEPLIGVRLKLNFEMNQYEDGILLRVKSLQFKDHVMPVDGYAIDIYANETPLFNNEVDTHFAEKFWARASVAFASPFIDFISTSTTTLVDGQVINQTTPVTSTKDRIIGGIANVAKEFVPDLAKRANIPSTIKVPKDYPANIVFSAPLYLPISLFEDDPTNSNDRSYENILGQNSTLNINSYK